MNPNMELNSLRWRLEHQDVPDEFVDSIVDAAAEDMNEAILDAVASSMAEAVEYANSIGAFEFADEIDVVQHGGIYQIVTLSGRTDYSTPEKEMRDSLLRNAKTSKDGSKYKVVPVGGKSSSSSVTSIFQDQKARQDMIAQARASIQDDLASTRSNRTGTMVDSFRNMLSNHRTTRQGFNGGRSSKSSTTTANKEPVFRTVTDKQDASSSWVMPAKEMDMTEYLRDLNASLSDHIVKAVTMIVKGYERLR